MYVSGNYGFLIRDAVENQDNEQQLHAREKGQNIPQLVITWAVQTPATTPPVLPTNTPVPTSTPTTTLTNTPTLVPTSTPTLTPTLAPTSTPPAPVTQNPIADAWVDQGSPSNNLGSDSILKVMSKGPSNNMRGLVQFNLPSVPEGYLIASVTLRIYSPSFSQNRTIEAWQIASSWTEMGVTWNNQPTTIGSPVITASGSGWLQWDVTAMVQAMYANGNYGFLIRDAIENQDNEQQFHAREKGENIPQLVFTFAPAGP